MMGGRPVRGGVNKYRPRGQEEGRKEEERAKVARVELNTREEKSRAEVVKEEGKREGTGKMELRRG